MISSVTSMLVGRLGSGVLSSLMVPATTDSHTDWPSRQQSAKYWKSGTTLVMASKRGCVKSLMKPTWLLAWASLSEGSSVTTEMGSLNFASISAWACHSSSRAVDHCFATLCGRVCCEEWVRQCGVGKASP